MSRLRQDGYAVSYVAELGQGISDDTVLELANQQGALLLTADLDFGDIVFRQRRFTSGVLLVRLPDLSPDQRAEVISATIQEYSSELLGNFAVLTPRGLRVRRVI